LQGQISLVKSPLSVRFRGSIISWHFS